MSHKKVSIDPKDRLRLIELVYDQGKKVREAADLLHIKLRTAYQICKIFERENRIEPKKRSGNRQRIYVDVFHMKIHLYYTFSHHLPKPIVF